MARVIILENYGNEEFRVGKKYRLYDGDAEMWQEYVIDDDGRKVDIDDLSRKCDWKKL